jgi:phosphoenolpyruvate carboxykinase (ATP)
MKLEDTRAMLNAALSGELESVPMAPDPVFRVLVPQTCPNVPSGMLDARGMWDDKSAYDRAAAALSARFRTNFEKFTMVDAEVREAAPVA